MEELKKLGHTAEFINPLQGHANLEPYDAGIFARGYVGEIMNPVIALKRAGRKIIFDTDDAIDVIPDFNVFQTPMINALPNFFMMLQMADLITVTSERLKRHVEQFTRKPIAVLPNCVREEDWQMRRGGNKMLRIGFAGSNTHVRDILIALEALVALQEKGYEFEFVLFGFGVESTFDSWADRNRIGMGKMAHIHPFGEALDRMEELIKQLKHFRWEKGVPFNEYPERLSELNFDIGLAPIEANEFNACKSCIKFYEYAMVGTPTIASNLPPFSDEMEKSDLVDNEPEAWEKKLAQMMDGEAVRTQMAEKQREWVLEERPASKWAKAREEAYRSIGLK